VGEVDLETKLGLSHEFLVRSSWGIICSVSKVVIRAQNKSYRTRLKNLCFEDQPL